MNIKINLGLGGGFKPHLTIYCHPALKSWQYFCIILCKFQGIVRLFHDQMTWIILKPLIEMLIVVYSSDAMAEKQLQKAQAQAEAQAEAQAIGQESWSVDHKSGLKPPPPALAIKVNVFSQQKSEIYNESTRFLFGLLWFCSFLTFFIFFLFFLPFYSSSFGFIFASADPEFHRCQRFCQFLAHFNFNFAQFVKSRQFGQITNNSTIFFFKSSCQLPTELNINQIKRIFKHLQIILMICFAFQFQFQFRPVR